MKFEIKKLLFEILLASFFSFFVANISFAATATLYGEVTDDGGDPYLLVWFQYGETPAYGFETPKQTKYGPGEFFATVTNLKECTTYHYRAVVRHQNYDDTTFGENKTFTTPCPGVFVDIKANGSDGPITVAYNSSVTLTWTSSNANYCLASGDWSGTKPISGSESISNLTSSKIFTLSCYGSTGSTSDSVEVKVQKVLGTAAVAISKLARNLSDGQKQFSDSVLADPGEVLEFKIVINSGTGAKNVILKDTLPSQISFRVNSLKIDGVSVSGEITQGISLGNLGANQTKTITFLADVAGPAHFNFGQTTLVNTATVSFDGNSLSDSVTIVVRKTGVLGATAVPTGLIKGVFTNPLFFIFVLSSIFLFQFLFLNFEKFFDGTKISFKKLFAKILLRFKIVKIKLKNLL